MLKRVGERTLHCGRLFFCSLHLLLSLFSSTYNLLFESRFQITLHSVLSCIMLKSFWIKSQWFIVSYAADRSTKAVPVLMLSWRQSSICCVRFNSWLAHDLSGLKPTCSLIRCCSMVCAILFSIILSFVRMTE